MRNPVRCLWRLGRLAHASAVAVATASAAIGMSALPAAADCNGPTIEYSAGEIARSGRITVVGTSFGDNCHDTGPPPAGEGVLGRPIRGITITLVQGDQEVFIARGEADEAYRFELTFDVPAELDAGEVTLLVTWPGGFAPFDLTDQPIVLTGGPPPATVPRTATAPSPGDDASTATGALARTLAALVVGGALAGLAVRRRRSVAAEGGA